MLDIVNEGEMKNKSWIMGFTVIFFLLSGLNVSAFASCAVDEYVNSCQNCGFDKYGDMDEACYEASKSNALECISTSYVMMALEYGLSGCPALDGCINKLKVCTAGSKCADTDKQDCSSSACMGCYEEADRCVYRASNDCSGEAECGDGKCEGDKGEDQESCCRDCPCDPNLKCEDNKCVEKEAGETSGCELGSNDKYVNCDASVYTEKECGDYGLAEYSKKYETVSLKCCYTEQGSRFCYYTVESDKPLASEVFNEGWNLLNEICLGGLLLPIALVSTAFLVESRRQ